MVADEKIVKAVLDNQFVEAAQEYADELLTGRGDLRTLVQQRERFMVARQMQRDTQG